MQEMQEKKERKERLNIILDKIMEMLRTEGCTYFEALQILKIARSNIERAVMRNKV